MGSMKRASLLTVAAAGLLSLLAPASISAQTTTTTTTTNTSTTPSIGQTIQLGATRSALVSPACPKGVSAANCTIVLTQSTALESLRDGVAYPTTVTQPGLIVAWTVGLSRLSNSASAAHTAIHYLDRTYGGTTQAGISVLAPVGAKSRHQWRVVAASPIVHLQPYLGYVVQFPLLTPLPVVAGDVVALTVKTWAPVLSFDLTPSKFAYRQSRSSNCSSPAATSQAQLTIGQSTRYSCNYPGTRVEYWRPRSRRLRHQRTKSTRLIGAAVSGASHRRAGRSNLTVRATRPLRARGGIIGIGARRRRQPRPATRQIPPLIPPRALNLRAGGIRALRRRCRVPSRFLFRSLSLSSWCRAQRRRPLG